MGGRAECAFASVPLCCCYHVVGQGEGGEEVRERGREPAFVCGLYTGLVFRVCLCLHACQPVWSCCPRDTPTLVCVWVFGWRGLQGSPQRDCEGDADRVCLVHVTWQGTGDVCVTGRALASTAGAGRTAVCVCRTAAAAAPATGRNTGPPALEGSATCIQHATVSGWAAGLSVLLSMCLCISVIT